MPFAKCVSVPIVAVVLLGAVTVNAQEPMPYGPPITLEQAKGIMAGAEAEADKHNWPW